MHISWLGSTALKIQTKPSATSDEVTVIIDPYKPKVGSFPRSLTPNITLYTRGQKESITISGDPYTLDHPGEIETNGVLITAIQGHDAEHIMYRLDTEGMSIAHVGLTNKQLTDAQIDGVGGVDILCLPVGGENSYDAEQAIKVVNAVEPRVVIPLNFKSENDPEASDVTNFLKSIGHGAVTPEKKAIFKKKDLPQEETNVIVLIKE